MKPVWIKLDNTLAWGTWLPRRMHDMFFPEFVELCVYLEKIT